MQFSLRKWMCCYTFATSKNRKKYGWCYYYFRYCIRWMGYFVEWMKTIGRYNGQRDLQNKRLFGDVAIAVIVIVVDVVVNALAWSFYISGISFIATACMIKTLIFYKRIHTHTYVQSSIKRTFYEMQCEIPFIIRIHTHTHNHKHFHIPILSICREPTEAL